MAASTDLNASVTLGDRITRCPGAAFITLNHVTTQLPATDDAMELPVGTTITVTGLNPVSMTTKTPVLAAPTGAEMGHPTNAVTFVTKPAAAAAVTTVTTGPASFRDSFKK